MAPSGEGLKISVTALAFGVQRIMACFAGLCPSAALQSPLSTWVAPVCSWISSQEALDNA